MFPSMFHLDPPRFESFVIQAKDSLFSPYLICVKDYMRKIAIFANDVSAHASSIEVRIGSPFNPITVSIEVRLGHS